VSDPAATIRHALHEVVGFDRGGYAESTTSRQTFHVIAKDADAAFAPLDDLEAFYRWKDAIVETLRYVSVNNESGDHVDEIQAEVDGLLGRLGVK
jgi:hypothetical protein